MSDDLHVEALYGRHLVQIRSVSEEGTGVFITHTLHHTSVLRCNAFNAQLSLQPQTKPHTERRQETS
jgi:hypothetical protein